jgi:NADH:ubiquinone oxidoreductase subunit 2 (subunit N)
MDTNLLKGALKSKTVWWNVLLALLASLEMFAGNLTTLFGQDDCKSHLNSHNLHL